MKSAWIVTDDNKIVDIVSSRKDFSAIYDYTIDLFCRLYLSLEEKFALAHYTRGNEIKRTVPIYTSFQTELYRELIRQTEKDIHSTETQKLLDEWKKAPEYVVVGWSPVVESRKAFNLELVGESLDAKLRYDYVLANGMRERRELELMNR